MKKSARISWSGVMRLRAFGAVLLLLTWMGIAAAASAADPAPPTGVPTEDAMQAFALQWFAQMQAGTIDRTQYVTAYGAQLTDDAVKAMSEHLNRYGALPIGAEVLQKRVVADQTLYKMKLIFPRGDASSFLFGFDAEGKISGIAVSSMAGD